MLVVRAVISKLKTERGLALQDLLIGAYEYIETIDFPPAARVYLLDHLATTEYVSPPFYIPPYPLFNSISRFVIVVMRRHRLSTGGSEKIQLTALLGAFKNAVELTEKAKAS